MRFGHAVYDYAHIGNFRAYIFEDVLRRYLKYKGYKVTQVMNLTDVDDKTIKRSQELNIPLQEFTKKYKEAFFQDLKTLNIEKAEYYPEATKHIKQMVKLIETLIKKGYAYKSTDNSFYFNIKEFKDYGKLSKLKLKKLIAGARVAQDEYEKESASDFALWKAYSKDDGNVYWLTSLGKGRPGWHIECSAMSVHYLGEHFDIHTGGIDNMFPHHENEIAQSEAATGKKFVSYWLHCEHLLVNNKKMSKSLGNYYTLKDLKSYNPIAIRYVLLANHYRQQLNFTIPALESAQNSVERIQDFITNLRLINSNKNNPRINKILEKTKIEFEKALDDDLNMPKALASIFILTKEINKLKISKKDAQKAIKLLENFDKVLGILDKEKASISNEIKELIKEREKARKSKDFKKADKIRSLLKKKGIILEDTPTGHKIK